MTFGVLLYPRPVFADYDSELLLFPYVQASFLSGLPTDSTRESDEDDYGLNLFAVVENERLVFLGEALIAKDEQEIERLQLGWRIGESKLWLGRFHNPIGYWNTQFHHGDYLQTSISRPANLEYEDDNGVLPMHLTGLLLEGVREQEDHGLGYAVAIALGPELSDQLEPLDVLEPTSGSQGMALTVNLFRQPVVYGPNQYGIFASYTEIPAPERGIDEIRQVVVGGYWNWESDLWRFVGSTSHTRNRFEQGIAEESDSFSSAYLQVERRLGDRWTVFGRAERMFGDDNDSYLELFPDSARAKILGGARVDLLERHAIKLEISRIRGQDDRFRELTLQWAAIF